MILISHRGNLLGKNLELENEPNYINAALKAGFFVEFDLWVIKNKLYLGHDEPKYLIEPKFIDNSFYYVHCKNEKALSYMQSKIWQCDYFWHEEDYYTLTSKNKIWVHPKSNVIPNSICVLKDENINLDEYSTCLGICSDYIGKLKK